MKIDPELLKDISDASSATSNPARAERNLRRFFETNPHMTCPPAHLAEIARLFSVSQFLANFCIAHPGELSSALNERGLRITRALVERRAEEELQMIEDMDIQVIMRRLRIFKKRYLLRLTLRYLLGETDIVGSMDELTCLAEVIISIALRCSIARLQQRYGEPSDESMTLIGLGKLGAGELNYSSDIDIIALYGKRGHTSGILTTSGVRTNRISNHEFYSRVMELWGRLLSSQTGEGVVYRVDLRLRPQGQKGELILPLEAYRTYYESWGRTWERMVLIRARPVAGDTGLGMVFMEDIRPFLWRRTLDYSEIEEIRGLKKKIDSAVTHDDIKRGYGGIREIEFFIHTFQLIYGPDNESLRTNSTLRALWALGQMNIIPGEDVQVMSENYLFLRRVEHLLQMREDLQTHRLPVSDDEIKALSREMGFPSEKDFLKDLRLRRMQIKSMYNSLLGTSEDAHAEALNLLEGGIGEEELKGYLSFRGIRDIERCLKDLKSIGEHMSLFRTMKERSILRRVVPPLIEEALSAEMPDRAIAGVETLLTTYGIKTAHLTAIMEQGELMKGIIKIFSLSPYLSRIFLSDQIYLDILIEEWRIMKTLKMLLESLKRKIKRDGDIGSSLACYKRLEEVRVGIFFLLDILKTNDLFRGLSHLAEAIIRIIIEVLGCKGLSVIALGKLGGREMNFGSDIDIIFLSQGLEGMGYAERIMRLLTTYTDNGMIYNVDARLRPDGSKGVLVNNIDGYRNYYLRKAHQWEIQALLRARPVAGDRGLGRAFIEMARDVIIERGWEIRQEGLLEMRERIIKELSRESEGMDIKLGPGGIEEIEFYVQFKQLRHAHRMPRILVQNTLIAITRLARWGLLNPLEAETLYNSYKYYRKIEAFLRLNEESIIADGAVTTELTARFMGHKDKEEFLSYLRSMREEVQRLTRSTMY